MKKIILIAVVSFAVIACKEEVAEVSASANDAAYEPVFTVEEYFDTPESQEEDFGLEEGPPVPSTPEQYEAFAKLVKYYHRLSAEESQALAVQPEGYYDRLGDANEFGKPLLPEDVAVEKAHIRLWAAHFTVSEAFDALSEKHRQQASKELEPLPFQLGVGAGETVPTMEQLKEFFGEEAESVFEYSVKGLFISPDYLSSFSMSEEEQERIMDEVVEEITNL